MWWPVCPGGVTRWTTPTGSGTSKARSWRGAPWRSSASLSGGRGMKRVSHLKPYFLPTDFSWILNKPLFLLGPPHCCPRSKSRKSRRTWRSTASSSTKRTPRGEQKPKNVKLSFKNFYFRSNKASAELAARRQKLMSSFSEWKEQKEEEYAMARWALKVFNWRRENDHKKSRSWFNAYTYVLTIPGE